MKDKLIEVFKALGDVETKGQSTFIVADARRVLASVIASLPDEPPKEGKEDD